MLQKFGYSQYESKVYEALVQRGEPLDATTVVKLSGVPKAKIYEVLTRLAEKGLVLDAVSGKKRTYAALPMDSVIDKLKREFERDIAELRETGVRKTYRDDQIWSLKSHASIQAYCKQMVEEAQESIVLSMWSDEFAEFAPVLERKEREGVQVEVLVTGKDTPIVSISKLHVLCPSADHEHLERFTLLVTDGDQVLFAGMEQGNWQAIRTMAQPFVTFFTEYFQHDVALTAITRKYAPDWMQDEELKSLLMRLRY
ncbi:TrmB family transcriptional regulator [Paenibacillus jiagnxiensis]|uniref:TrmB family transcriptional regulator n=1 Tax=Paenibacillus jiagnxiensis TaxID=3228926 RepID=UPI0033A80BF1